MRAAALTPADEEAEYQRCSAINEDWNLEIAKVRDARVAKENAERRVYIAQRIEDKKVRDKQLLLEMEERVRKEKEVAPTFITRENIDQAIETALANPVDFNFAIDPSGNKYHGLGKLEKAAEKPVEP